MVHKNSSFKFGFPRQIIAGIIGFALILLAPICAQAEAIDPFVGDYHGRTIQHAEGELQARDLDVKIVNTDLGFIVDWSTLIHKPDGREKTVSLSIEFFDTERPGIFGSAMRSGLFGKRIPNDPLQGQPFFWARIVDKTLTIHALYILDDGGYEMQVYERTLDENNDLDLVFKRFRNGKQIRDVTGELARQPEN